jgi:hypothetical protein
VAIHAGVHDTGLVMPFSDAEQRFEVDGADHGRKFLLDRNFSPAAADTVWTAIALHTTPGIPDRMGPEIASLYLGVATDVLGYGLGELHIDQVSEIVALHPRGDFKRELVQDPGGRPHGGQVEQARGTCRLGALDGRQQWRSTSAAAKAWPSA